MIPYTVRYYAPSSARAKEIKLRNRGHEELTGDAAPVSSLIASTERDAPLAYHQQQAEGGDNRADDGHGGIAQPG